MKATSSPAKRPSSLNLIDTNFLFRVTERLRKDTRPPALNYRELLRCLETARRELGFRVADQTFAPSGVDLRSESQMRFVEALRQIGIVVDALDYRATFVSTAVEDRDRPPTSLAPYLTYIAGLIAERAQPELVIVTGAFDVYLPLLDFTARRGGKAAICFFRSFLDPRWTDIARLDPNHGSGIRFHDLDSECLALTGVAIAPDTRDVGGSNAPGGLSLI